MRVLNFLIAITAIAIAFFLLMLVAYGTGGWVEACAAMPVKKGLLCGDLLGWLAFKGGSNVYNILWLVLIPVMITATLLTIAERKWSAFTQDRMGPNRARLGIIPGLKDRVLGGIPHIAADVLKMLTKESFRPKAANPLLFALGPILAFGPVVALAAIIQAGPTLVVMRQKLTMVVANPDFGLLYIFAIASLAVYGTSLAGWSSNNKFGLLGGVRASSQMISYEVALGLSLVGIMMAFSTVQLAGDKGISAMQAEYLWRVAGVDFGIPKWGILLQPVGFILFFAASFAETKRAPFDLPEGDSEIVGYFIEYSGMQFGLFMISEFVEVVVLGAVITAVFFGGWWLPFGNEAVLRAFGSHTVLAGAFFGMVFWLKVVFLCWVQLMVRWTFPRFRYDQIQSLGWKILLPLGLGNVFVSGALILWDPSLQALALVGFLEMGVLAFLTLTAPRQERQKAEKLALEAEHGHGHGGHDAHAHDAHAAHDAPHRAPALPH